MIVQSANKQLFYEYLNSGIYLGSGFINSFLLLFWLKDDLFAQYSVTIALMSILRVLTSFGIYTFSVQYIKHTISTKDRTLPCVILITESLSLVLGIGAFLIVKIDAISLFTVVTAISFAISDIIKSRISTIKLVLANNKNSKIITKVSLIENSSKSTLIIASFFIAPQSPDLCIIFVILIPSLIAYNALMNMCSSLSIYTFMPTRNDFHRLLARKPAELKKVLEYFRNSIKLYASNTINVVYDKLPIILLNYLGSSSLLLSAFALAKTFSSYLYLIPFNMYRVYFARCNIKSKRSIHSAIRNYSTKAILISLLAILCNVGLFQLLSLAVPSALYQEALFVAYILVFGILPQSFNCLFYLIAQICNEINLQVYINFLTLITLVLCSYMFFDWLGSISVTISVAIAPLLSSLLALIVIRNKYKTYICSLNQGIS